MINIRYHVYSLVAVFLALAIGVAVGSTVVQRSVVDNLRSTQGRIEQNLDDLEAQNAALQERTAALDSRSGSLTEEGPGALLTGALTSVPIMVIWTQGVSADSLGQVQNALDAAGADTVAEVELQAALADPEALVAFAPELGLPEDERSPEQVQAAIGEQLADLVAAAHAERTGPPPLLDPVVSDTAPTTDAPVSVAARELAEFLQLLDDAGLASVRGTLGEPGVTTDHLELAVVGGLTRDLDPMPVLGPLLESLATDPRPMAVATDAGLEQPLGEGEEAYGVVAAVRNDGQIRDRVSTVDDVDDFAGLGALVLSLAGLTDGQVGHYGLGDGADALLPTGRS